MLHARCYHTVAQQKKACSLSYACGTSFWFASWGMLCESGFVKIFSLLGTQFWTFCDQVTVLSLKIPPHLIHRTCCCGKTFWYPLLVWRDTQSQPPPKWSLNRYWVKQCLWVLFVTSFGKEHSISSLQLLQASDNFIWCLCLWRKLIN